MSKKALFILAVVIFLIDPSLKAQFSCGDIVYDVDGNAYPTVLIGSQCWFAKNLRTTSYNDGTTITRVTNDTDWSNASSGAYCWAHWDSTAYADVYGALYNWYTVETGKMCPTGWHVPSDAEWYTMENFVDATINNPASIGYRGTDAGKKLKATSGWMSGGNGTDDYGFAAMPGGSKPVLSGWNSPGNYVYIWTSTANGSEAWLRNFVSWDARSRRDDQPHKAGFSVRCVAPNTLPVGLLYFDANCKNNEIHFHWATASEINNEAFIIEKTADTKNWMEIARISGAGNANAIINYEYTYTINNPQQESYYRLSQVDYNGTTKKFNSLSIDCAKQQNTIPEIYPNPFSNHIYVNTETNKQEISITIYNIYGAIVVEKNAILSGEKIELESLASGTYIALVQMDNQRKYLKIIKE